MIFLTLLMMLFVIKVLNLYTINLISLFFYGFRVISCLKRATTHFNYYNFITVLLCLVAQSCLTLVTPQIVACQASLSMEFSRQEYWSGLPCPPPGDLPHPGIEPRSPALQADSLPSEPPVLLHTKSVGYTRRSVGIPGTHRAEIGWAGPY